MTINCDNCHQCMKETKWLWLAMVILTKNIFWDISRRASYKIFIPTDWQSLTPWIDVSLYISSAVSIDIVSSTKLSLNYYWNHIKLFLMTHAMILGSCKSNGKSHSNGNEPFGTTHQWSNFNGGLSMESFNFIAYCFIHYINSLETHYLTTTNRDNIVLSPFIVLMDIR